MKESCRTARLFLFSGLSEGFAAFYSSCAFFMKCPQDRSRVFKSLESIEQSPSVLQTPYFGYSKGVIFMKSLFHNKILGIHNKTVGQVRQNSIFEKSLVKIPNLTCRWKGCVHMYMAFSYSRRPAHIPSFINPYRMVLFDNKRLGFPLDRGNFDWLICSSPHFLMTAVRRIYEKITDHYMFSGRTCIPNLGNRAGLRHARRILFEDL